MRDICASSHRKCNLLQYVVITSQYYVNATQNQLDKARIVPVFCPNTLPISGCGMCIQAKRDRAGFSTS